MVIGCCDGGGNPGDTGGGGRGLFRSFGVHGETGDKYAVDASGLNEESVFIPSFGSLPREAVCYTVAIISFPWRCARVEGLTLPPPTVNLSSASLLSTVEGETS